MSKSEHTMPAGEFKAKCLKVLDQVASTREVIVVTKRGKPVAKVVPLAEPDKTSLRGSVTASDDLVEPVKEAWSAAK
ncbi:MAG: type II toxin-antitoxin system Phd/YefM family antitoxin [Myxococcota bacterium]